MKNGSRANALLIELLIVILFFMFAATTLVELFGAARERSRRAEILSAAALASQNAAEALYDAEETEPWLKEMGFAHEENGWIREEDGYALRGTEEKNETEAGVLRTVIVAAEYDGETILALPSVRYQEKEAAP